VRTTIEFTTPDGAPYEPLDADVHHRNETVAGLADPWLLLRVGATWQRWWFAARPGISLPLGRTEADPFELGDQGERHQHIQLGSGTFDPVLVLETSGPMGDFTLQAFAQGNASLYENTHGYQAPWKVYGGVAVGTSIVGDLSGSLGVEGFHEAAERWQGAVRQDGTLGRSEMLLAGNLTQSFGATEFGLGVRVPVYRHIVQGTEEQGTLSSPLTHTLRFSHVFGASQNEPQPAE
jgi:hypothetical protein